MKKVKSNGMPIWLILLIIFGTPILYYLSEGCKVSILAAIEDKQSQSYVTYENIKKVYENNENTFQEFATFITEHIYGEVSWGYSSYQGMFPTTFCNGSQEIKDNREITENVKKFFKVMDEKKVPYDKAMLKVTVNYWGDGSVRIILYSPYYLISDKIGLLYLEEDWLSNIGDEEFLLYDSVKKIDDNWYYYCGGEPGF